MLTIHQIPALTDNFIYILRDEDTGVVAAVDPSEAEPVLEFLETRRWKLSFVLSTHHHWDHVNGNLGLQQVTGCRVVGFERDRERIPGINVTVKEDTIFPLGGSKAKILFIPGHTLGHIAYWFSSENAVFVGDTLFSMGCGRLFEGSPPQMYESLNKLKALPDETRVFCGHEYTEANLEFALSLTPNSPELQAKMKWVHDQRKNGKFTVPSLMKEEKALNPFLTVKSEAEFAKIREAKDDF